MGEGVEMALVDVAMDKGNLRREEAEEFLGKEERGWPVYCCKSFQPSESTQALASLQQTW